MIDEATRQAYEVALRAALRDQARASATVEFFREKLGLAEANAPILLGPVEPDREDEGLRDVGPVQVTDSEFYGMSQTKAAAAFLERAGRSRPQRTEAIIAALQKGGVRFEGKNPVGTFYAILSRTPTFHRVGKSTWGLSAWYPNAVRKPKVTATAEEALSGEPSPDMGSGAEEPVTSDG